MQNGMSDRQLRQRTLENFMNTILPIATTHPPAARRTSVVLGRPATKASVPANGSRIRSGLSLLEVLLALSILGVAGAILSQIISTAADNSIRAEKLSRAQMIADSKMSEVVAGLVQPQSVPFNVAQTDFDGTVWYYELQVVPSEQQNMLGIQMTITDDPNGIGGMPIVYRLTRAIIDPSLGLDQPESTDATGDAGSTGTTGTTGGGA